MVGWGFGKGGESGAAALVAYFGLCEGVSCWRKSASKSWACHASQGTLLFPFAFLFQEALSDLSHNSQRAMMGNAMHISGIGAAILLALSCTEHVVVE